MFFVTLLLNQTLAWMRAQSGTTSLRAILYMDEIAGYFPPVATPPAKAPLLTLLKQGRAFGLGVVLATQNPVDLDYKGLANTGRGSSDGCRRSGTRPASSRVSRAPPPARRRGSTAGEMEQTLAGLGSRVFLLNNVHEDEPVVFETRWAMSYLRGPLTRSQIKTLMDPRRKERPANARRRLLPSVSRPRTAGARPVLPPESHPALCALAWPRPRDRLSTGRPGRGRGPLPDSRSGLSSTETLTRVAPISDPVDWSSARSRTSRSEDLERRSRKAEPASPSCRPPPASRRSGEAWPRTSRPGSTGSARSSFCAARRTRAMSKSGRDRGGLPRRLGQDSAREARDARPRSSGRSTPRSLASLQERLRRAQQAVAREKEETMQAGVSRRRSRSAPPCSAPCSAARRSRRRRSAAPRRRRADGRPHDETGGRRRPGERDRGRDRAADPGPGSRAPGRAGGRSAEASDPATEKLESVSVRPKKTDVTVRRVASSGFPHEGWNAFLNALFREHPRGNPSPPRGEGRVRGSELAAAHKRLSPPRSRRPSPRPSPAGRGSQCVGSGLHSSEFQEGEWRARTGFSINRSAEPPSRWRRWCA